jgi:hypothetical protein
MVGEERQAEIATASEKGAAGGGVAGGKLIKISALRI